MFYGMALMKFKSLGAEKRSKVEKLFARGGTVFGKIFQMFKF